MAIELTQLTDDVTIADSAYLLGADAKNAQTMSMYTAAAVKAFITLECVKDSELISGGTF